MNSSPADRLAVVYAAYKAAYSRREADLEAAAGQPEAQQKIFQIVDGLELAYLKASRAALEENGPEIEAAYLAAKAASEEVDRAYRAELALNARIQAASAALGAVTNLVSKASGSG